MNLEEFRETLETLKDSELIKYVQRYVCLSLADAEDPSANSHTLLDLIYVECIRRIRLMRVCVASRPCVRSCWLPSIIV